MEKKYQVFVSSTYKDLTDERKEVIQALLELDCIPVGMEMFPAADDDQWTLIKNLINDCDYYVLIVGARYGSVDDEGMSYTQKEYEYAVQGKIPIISFLHKNPDEIPSGKTEQDPKAKERLKQFLAVVQNKMCRYWITPADLGSQVSRSLVKLIKTNPRPGWVKATDLPTEDAIREILDLKAKIERMKLEADASKSQGPEGTEDFSQGEDEVDFSFMYIGVEKSYPNTRYQYESEFSVTWNEIFAAISPLMIDEATDDSINSTLKSFIFKKEKDNISESLAKTNRKFAEIKANDTLQTIKVQFRALGLITESNRKRSIHDKDTYWQLTPYGDNVMTRLRAIKRV
ncbi:DUF4062 domain-containing protein [Hymenobacter glaciei]|uniref:DUF4062 domain-containing protein n=1 Tax=Hymenobacter glaciei TaxID=877209 RepID=A0ABP7T4N3_9BACT